MARLKEVYKSEVAPALMKKFGYKSPMQIPRFEKVVINVGSGDSKDNSKVTDAIINDLGLITEAPKDGRKKRSESRSVDMIAKMFNEIGPKYADRNGGYTRVLKLGPRRGDGAEMAIIELV